MAKAEAKGDKEYENALRQHTKNQSDILIGLTGGRKNIPENIVNEPGT